MAEEVVNSAVGGYSTEVQCSHGAKGKMQRAQPKRWGHGGGKGGRGGGGRGGGGGEKGAMARGGVRRLDVRCKGGRDTTVHRVTNPRGGGGARTTDEKRTQTAAKNVRIPR